MELFKRILKIFAIVFSSMVGLFAITYGIMYLAGSFNEPEIQPEDLVISVAENEKAYVTEDGIFVDNDFYLIINTTTENANQKDIELTLDNVTVNNVSLDGKISDGKILIPSQVKLGEKFKVELIKQNETFGGQSKDWIVGGISSIIAKSKTNLLLVPVSQKVYIDVPVFGIELKAYPNITNMESTDTFIVNSSYILKPDFIPQRSAFKFSQDGTNGTDKILKTVYTTISSSDGTQYTARNTTGQYSNNLYTAKKVGAVSFVSYVFNTSLAEKDARTQYDNANEVQAGLYSENQIYTEMTIKANEFIQQSLMKTSSINVNFTKVTNFSYNMSGVTKDYRADSRVTYFANYNSDTANTGNLGVNFSAVGFENLVLQDEIKNIGVSLVKVEGETKAIKDLGALVYGDKKYVAYRQFENIISSETYLGLSTSQKELYTKIADVEFYGKMGEDLILLSTEYDELAEEDKEEYREIKINETLSVYGKYHGYCSYLDYEELSASSKANYDLVQLLEADYEDKISETTDRAKFAIFYYLSLSQINVELSKIEFSVENADAGSYLIYTKYFGEIATNEISSKSIPMNIISNTSQPISWKNNDLIEMYVRYEEGEEGWNAGLNEYNLAVKNNVSNLEIPVENIYTTTKYFAYTTSIEEETSDLSLYLENAVKRENTYTPLGINTAYNLYELTNGIFKVKDDKIEDTIGMTFHIIFATIKTEANGNLIFNLNRYEFDKESTNNIEIDIVDSLQTFSADLTVTADASRYYEDIETTGEGEDIIETTNFVSFVQNTVDAFSVEIAVPDGASESQKNLLSNEIANIESANLTSNIQFIAREVGSNTDILSQILTFQKRAETENYIYDFSIKENSSLETRNFNLYLYYTKTNEYKLIGKYSTTGETAKTDENFEFLQIYSGKAERAVFGTYHEGDGELSAGESEYISLYNTSTNPINVKIEIASNDVGTITGVQATYKMLVADTLVDIPLFDENGAIIISFKDKYGKSVVDGDYVLESDNLEVLVISSDGKSFIFTGNNGQAGLKLKLNGIDQGKTIYLEYSALSVALGEIKARAELVVPEYANTQLVSVYDKTRDGIYDFEKIEVKLYGAKDREVLVSGANGFISAKYIERMGEGIDDRIYDITSLLKYTIAELDANLQEMVEFTTENDIIKLKFLDNFANQARIKITATVDELKFSQQIDLVIMKNMDVSLDITSSSSGATSKTDATGAVYTGVYGGTEVDINYNVSYVLAGTNTNTVVDYGEDGEEAIQLTESKPISLAMLDVTNYTDKVFKFTSGNNQYKYNRLMYFYINPNIKITNVPDTYTQVVEDRGTYIQIVGENNSVEFGRIEETEATIGSIKVVGEIINNQYVEVGSTNSNFVKYDNNCLYLKNSVEQTQSFKIVFGYADNGYKIKDYTNNALKSIEIETIDPQTSSRVMSNYYYAEIDVVPKISIKEDSTAFINYNGQRYLALVSGKDYDVVDILANFETTDDTEIIFDNVERSNTSVYSVITEEDSKILRVNTIYSIYGDDLEYFMTISTLGVDGGNLYQYLKVPVIFIPFDYPLFEVSESYKKNNDLINEVDFDYKNILDRTYLQTNNLIYNKAIYCGQEISLDEIIKLDSFKGYTFSIVNEDPNDLETYATITKTTEGGVVYIIKTGLFSEDVYVYILARLQNALGDKTHQIPIRLKIVSNLSLKAFYPYDTTGDRELIKFGEANTYTIDFEQAQSSAIPNKASDGKRFEVRINDTRLESEQLLSNITKTYRIKKVEVGNSVITEGISNYATINNSVLTLKKFVDAFTVTVEIDINNGVVKGDYVIEVVDDESSYTLFVNDELGEDIEYVNNVFKIDENKTVDLLNCFNLKEYLAGGSIERNADNLLRFYVYNNEDRVSISGSELTTGSTVVKLNSVLVVYTIYGRLNSYNLEINSSTTAQITPMSISANNGEGTLVNLSLNSIDCTSEIEEVKIIKYEIGLEEYEPNALGSIVNFVDGNGYQSTISIVDKKVVVSPILVEGKLTISIKFTHSEQTATLNHEITISPDVVSKYETSETAPVVEKTAGQSVTLVPSDYFDGARLATNYDISYKILSDESLVDADNLNLRFRNSAVNGNILVELKATAKNNASFVLKSYVKFTTTANLTYSVNYPTAAGENQTAEYVASGSAINLTTNSILSEDERVTFGLVGGGNLGSNAKIKISSVKNAEIAEHTLNNYYDLNSELIINLLSGTEGRIQIGIYFSSSEEVIDLVGMYNVVVRPTWNSIFKTMLLNEDDTTNSISNPEYQMNGVNLDIASYEDDDEYFNKLILGYDTQTSEYRNKSMFYYFVDNTNNNVLSYEKFTFSKSSLSVDETTKKTTLVLDIKIADNLIGQYFVEFEFNVTFTATELTYKPGHTIVIKNAFGIQYNENYNFELEKDGANTKIEVYSRKVVDGAWLRCNSGNISGMPDYETTYLNFITFENDDTNIRINGAPNFGVKVIFTAKISYNSQVVSQKLEITVNPDYVVSINATQPYTINASEYTWSNAQTMDLTLTQSAIENSIIFVAKENATQTNVLLNSSYGFTGLSSNQTFVANLVLNTIKGVVTITKPSFGTQNVTITIKDKYDYKIVFNMVIVPEQQIAPIFKTNSLTEYELNQVNLVPLIKNYSDNIKITEYNIVDGEENILLENTGANLTSLVVPNVTSQTATTLKLKLEKGTETAWIDASLIIKRKYELVKDSTYFTDGILNARDGEEINLNDIYNVKDLQNNVVIGQRELLATKSFNIDDQVFSLSEIYVFQGSGEYPFVATIKDELSNGAGNVICSYIDNNEGEQTEYISSIQIPMSVLFNTGYDQQYIYNNYSLYRYVITINNKIYNFSGNQIVNSNGILQIDFEETNIKAVVEGSNIVLKVGDNTLTIKVSAISNEAKSGKVSALENFSYLADGRYNYYLPFELFPTFETYEYQSYQYVWATSLTPSLFTPFDNSTDIVDDYLFSIGTTNLSANKKVMFVTDEQTDCAKTIEVPFTEVKNWQCSVRTKFNFANTAEIVNIRLFSGTMKVDVEGNYNANGNETTYVRGLSQGDLALIKSFDFTTAQVYEDIDLVEEIYSANVIKIDEMVWSNTNPYYQHKQYVLNSDINVPNGVKTFSNTLVVRVIPNVQSISYLDGSIESGEFGYNEVAFNVTLADSTRQISFKTIGTELGWASQMLVLNENAKCIYKNEYGKYFSGYTVAEYYEENLTNNNKLSFAVKVEEGQTATAEIDLTSKALNILPNFDFVAGHITIEIFAEKNVDSTEIYKVKIGELIVTPRR